LLSRLNDELDISEEQFLKLLKENTIDSFEKIFKGVFKTITVDGGKKVNSTRYLGLEWTSLPNGIEVAKPDYNGRTYKYTPAIFRAFYGLALEDQKRILNGEETKYNNKRSIYDEAIPKVLEEARTLTASEQDARKKIEISQKIIGQNSIPATPVPQPVRGKPAEGAAVAQAPQPNGRNKPS